MITLLTLYSISRKAAILKLVGQIQSVHKID